MLKIHLIFLKNQLKAAVIRAAKWEGRGGCFSKTHGPGCETKLLPIRKESRVIRELVSVTTNEASSMSILPASLCYLVLV